MFRVGQKVVCIDDLIVYPAKDGRRFPYLKAGNVYTIAWVGNFKYLYSTNETLLAVHLAEVLRPVGKKHGCRVPFGAHRFRPAVDRKTDISVFEKLLIGTPSRALVGDE